MKLEYSNLSRDGLIIEPRIAAGAQAMPAADVNAAQSFLDTGRDSPEIAGFVPNLTQFTAGEDCDIGAFEIKAQGSRLVCLPASIAHLLPATAVIIDDFYRHAGALAADQCQISLQFFRASYKRGQQLPFDRIHRHATEGKMAIYVATAIFAKDRVDPRALGTEYYAERVMGQRITRARRADSPEAFRSEFEEAGVVAAPGGAIIRFSETTLHAAPDITAPSPSNNRFFGTLGPRPLRRSLLNIIASHKQEGGTVYGRTRPPNDHRLSPVESIKENEDEYRKAAGRVLAGLCPG